MSVNMKAVKNDLQGKDIVFKGVVTGGPAIGALLHLSEPQAVYGTVLYVARDDEKVVLILTNVRMGKEERNIQSWKRYNGQYTATFDNGAAVDLKQGDASTLNRPAGEFYEVGSSTATMWRS